MTGKEFQKQGDNDGLLETSFESDFSDDSYQSSQGS